MHNLISLWIDGYALSNVLLVGSSVNVTETDYQNSVFYFSLSISWRPLIPDITPTEFKPKQNISMFHDILIFASSAQYWYVCAAVVFICSLDCMLFKTDNFGSQVWV
jgi:hypothetical protein